ncbi:ribonuclease P protein component [Flavobacteriaceae bacterium R38]|nr:ribonuclease P protein component [Flavobacteriaceae bacterium R38]
MSNSFPKEEKLKSRKLIEKLFSDGKSVSKFPLKLVFIPLTEHQSTSVNVLAGFSVPKRKFKKAVDRNHIKRLIRESYRLQKTTLFNNLPTSYAFMFLYLGKEQPSFIQLNKSMEQLLNRFLKQINKQ